MQTTWTAEGVKALRVSLGLSQSFAKFGCHVRAVSQWEHYFYAKALDDLRDTIKHRLVIV
jgi:DNA-binding transcriptional regulator YiaG